MIELIKLPYAHDEFEPVIDKETMEIHHGRHLNTYVTNYNNTVEGTKYAEMDLEEILTNINDVDAELRAPIQNNGGGVFNHNFYFSQFKKGTELADGELKTAIEETFGSVENLLSELQKAGATRFGSGWSWLVLNNGKLEVMSTPNQETPLAEGKTPLITLDVWEHAYYLKYQNKRPEYLSQIVTILNWEEIERRFNEAK